MPQHKERALKYVDHRVGGVRGTTDLFPFDDDGGDPGEAAPRPTPTSDANLVRSIHSSWLIVLSLFRSRYMKICLKGPSK
mmetsp:Transcript_17884/g.46223  ORF Transcript_17884/g.46223 Transcript_17884/m.46223 type:complete len:80 (+) Transcript_17884:106-345(+)